MKCISLWQPWASLWVSGVKIHETRHWPTSIRGTIAVHAAKRPIDKETRDYFEGLAHAIEAVTGKPFDMETLPFGCIVGTVHLTKCVPVEEVYDESSQDLWYCAPVDYRLGNYERGRFAWRGDNPVQFAEPIPFKGAQGFFDVEVPA